MKKHKLIVISGPTAVGKTSFAIALAKQLNCPVLSSDAAAVNKDRSINALFSEFSKLNIKIKSMRNESNRLEELFIEMVNSNEK